MLSERVKEWTKEWVDQGRDEGRIQGLKEALLHQLETRFGEVSPKVRERVESAKPDLLPSWLAKILVATSLKDVFQE